MAETHTPGPWIVVVDRTHDLALVDVMDADGETVCEFSADEDRDKANARLIAAAPDLLAAAKAALNDRMYKEWPPVADLLMAAIAKAEGR